MENNLENKARFFAQYWGQGVFVENEKTKFPMNLIGIDSDTGSHVFDNGIRLRMNFPIETGLLQLTPLSQITDEDSIEISIKNGALKDLPKVLLIQLGKEYVKHILGLKTSIVPSGKQTIETYKILISKGYYVGDGAEIEYGWVKLKSNINER